MDFILNFGVFISSIIILIIIILMGIRQRKDYEKINGKLLRMENESNYLKESIARTEQILRDELGRSREEAAISQRNLGDSLIARINEMVKLQHLQSDSIEGRMVRLSETNEKALVSMKNSMEASLKEIREDTNRSLEIMRSTVDEKLHETLEQRLGESFKIVSERLELVHKGLGEMQNLASGVGDLKKILTNVKTRGIWGEIQLGNILEQILTPEQYATNVATKKNSRENVEYAIRLPGKGGDGEEVLLPIDAKFPIEDYRRLVEASEAGDKGLMEESAKRLESSIKTEAKRISSKYINPPYTTDFAIMFLPVESLYGEVVKRPGLLEDLQKQYRINISGPSTMAAFLNSLSMGFRTLAIEKRSGEIWGLLGAVKTEFSKFGALLEKTQKKLQEASNVINDVNVRSRAIERKLRDVEELPIEETKNLLEETAATEE